MDGEATEPMIKELEEDREESLDPEVEFAIAGAVRECDGLEILLDMIKVDRNILFYICRLGYNVVGFLNLKYYRIDTFPSVAY